MYRPPGQVIKYFGYGTNKDIEMMVYMVGRDDIKGEPGKLIGYELCIQNLEHIRGAILPSSPLPISPREVIRKAFGETFELYIARPKADGIIYGTIWDLTPEEIEFVKEWEMIDFGMQEEVNAMAINTNGDIVAVETQAVMEPLAVIDKVITGDDYPAYIAPKDKMLRIADETRLNYLKRKNL